MLSDRGYGLRRPTLQDEDLAELDAIYSTGSMASQPIYSNINNNNGVFFPSSPSPSLSRSNSHPALQDDGKADEDDGFLLGFGAGLVEAEDAHEAEYTAADSQKVLLEFDDHGADRRTALQRQREQQRATAALERSARQYRERVDAVLRGQHLITLEQAVELAGLQIQIEFGEYIRPGAIELCLVLPHRYAGAKGVEAMCFAEHTKVKDKTDAEAREQYIKTCRATRTYGALHTTMHEKIRGKSKRVARIVGVTLKDFICVEPETHEIAASYALSSIRRWATNDTAAPAATAASTASPSPSSPPSASPKDDAAADGPGSLTIWFGNGTTEGTVVRFETKRQAAASAAEALLITALKSIRKVRPASSASALSAGCSETDYTTDDGFHSPSPASQQQRHRRRAQRRSSAHTPTSDYATTPDGTPEVQRRSSSGKKHRRSASAARAAASAFTLASPAASGISRRRSQPKASSAAAGASAAPSPFSAPASSAPSSAASSPGSSRRVMASTKGDSIVYNASPTPSSADGGASTASLTSKKNRRWSTASIESGGSVGSVRSAGASPSPVAGGASASPTNRWSWPQAAAGEAAAAVPGLPRTSPLRHSISASGTALNSKAGSAATYAVPRRRASISVVVEVVPMPMPLQPSLDGDRASGGAVYDLLRSEMTRLRSSVGGDYI